MAIHKFNDPRIYLGGYAITTDLSTATVSTTAETLDATKFTDTTRIYIGGLKTHSLSCEGNQSYGAAEIENIIRQQVALSGGTVYTVTPEGGSVGEEAFFGTTLVSAHQPVGGTVGDLHKFTFSGVAANGYPCIKGQLFKAAGSTTSSTTSSAVQLGAVSATQRIFIALHVLSVSGSSPTLDIKLQSDDNSGFTSATDRITLTQATTAGTAQFTSLAGAVTDNYWRISYTIGGSSTPTFSFVVAVGIL